MADSNTLGESATLALPIKSLVKRAPLFIDAGVTVAQAAHAMQAARVGSILIGSEPPGIVTDRDLRGRVLAANLGPDTAITRVMSHPLVTIDSDAPAFAALRLMLEENIHHLPVTEDRNIIGVISATDLLLLQRRNPLYLRSVIEEWDPTTVGVNYADEIGKLVETLDSTGLAAIHISKLVSSLNDALVKRLVVLAAERLGPAPTPFAWIVFGSEGRLEQTLLTDQDNGLIFQDDSAAAREYFAALAKQVVNTLIGAGFPPCAGGFMATRWCKPLASWRELFTRWIRLPEPQALLDAAIFFDFRPVAGTLELEELEEIITTAKSEKLFLSHLARGALDFHPPLGFFNRLRSDNGQLDLKKGAITPIVSLARLAALAAGSRERSTLERLEVAKATGRFLGFEEATALAEIFPMIFQLRLRAQLSARAAKVEIDHSIRLSDLTALERSHLKQALVIIQRVQKAMRTLWQLDRLA
jgi:CBS domain-containing protein